MMKKYLFWRMLTYPGHRYFFLLLIECWFWYIPECGYWISLSDSESFCTCKSDANWTFYSFCGSHISSWKQHKNVL